METRICPQCGKQIPADAITCKYCGTLFFASPNELEGESSLQEAYNQSFAGDDGEYYSDEAVKYEYDENGGYYDENGNYYDASGGHFDAEGNYYDTEGGYYDKDGNYYDKDGNFFPGYYDDEGNYHEGVRPGSEEPEQDIFGIADVALRPETPDEDIAEDFRYTEDGDVDNSAPEYAPAEDAKYRKTMIIALSVILVLIVFLIVVVLKSRSNLSGFSKKYDVSRTYTNYVPATVPGDSGLDSDHRSDSDEILSEPDSLPEAVIPDSIPGADSSSEAETTTTTATTPMPDEVIPETTTTPTTTTPTTTPEPDPTPTETTPTETTPSDTVTSPDDSGSEPFINPPEDSSEEDDSSEEEPEE